MNKKGFTLIEIIGAIVILGIIAIIAFATYTNSLKEFRDDYYTSVTRTLNKSGEEFFSDNRNYRPSKTLQAQEVPINTLITKKYITGVVDYNGDACSDTSYVLAVKEGRDKYSYHTCLVCLQDGYDNTKTDKYCDRSWLDPTKIEYGLGEMEEIYIYKGTDRETLRNELELPVSYVRYNNEGEILASVRGTGEGEPTILPNNIDVVNTDVEGEYSVVYEYRGKSDSRKVIVYENSAPTVIFKTEKTLIDGIDGITKTTTVNFNNGDWAQNIIVKLNSQSYAVEGLSTSRFQWNVDGKWEDFCNTDPCERKITREMNQMIQFRLVDTNGKISKLTDPIAFKIDNTKPKCTLQIPTTKGDNDWYKTDVKIEFASKYDQKLTSDESIVSGIKYYNIQISTTPKDDFVREATNASFTHTTDGTGYKYIGIVEDKAGNFNTCESEVFKRDATPPDCSVSSHASIACTDDLSKVNRWRYSKTNDSAGTYTTVTATNNFTHDASDLITTSGTYYLYTKDVAGNISVLKSYNYYDVTYNKNGGTTNPTKSSDIIRSGNYADLSPTATKDGYSFVGWNTDSSATTKLTSHIVTKTTTLYAIYKQCAAGTYSKNSLTCSDCTAGTYSNAGASSCTKCSAGTYSGAKAAKCTACPAGQYNTGEGNTGCTKCSAGTYNTGTGNTSCTACPAGQYNTGEGNTGCTKCSAGKYNTGTGNTSCTNCSAGTYNTGEGNTGCTNCSAGTYNTGEGNTGCTACGGGKYSNAGATSCSDITAGCYGTSAGSACPNECSAGTYSNAGASTCTACGGGKYSGNKSSSCSDITAGCYGTSAGSSCPNECSAGTYSSAGSSSCSNCTGDTYSGNKASSCTACPSGQTANSDHTGCVALSPRVTMWVYEAKVEARCGAGGYAEVSSIRYTCNGTWCGTINETNCRLYAFWIEPPAGQSFSSITISFSGVLPDAHVAWVNSYNGAPSGLPGFQGLTYFPGSCAGNDSTCENGGGTNNNFFSYNGNTYMFRFRPSADEYLNETSHTLSGTITVGYSGGGSANYDFSYYVSRY